jgi:riboflavin kinase/FMN adenylyltransferase
MDVVNGVDRLTAAHGRLFVAIGVFDGLHRGHRYLLRHLRREATRRAARPTVVTFDHHPDEIILGAAPPLLCDPDERLELLTAAGVDVIVVEHFDAALRATAYDAFVRAISGRVDLAGFLMTPDAAFGYERQGTPAAVAALGVGEGFEVVVVPPLDLDGGPVRSSEVRGALARGDLARARRLLGRAVEVVGDVAGDPRDGSASLTFQVPVALPPDGRYRATVRPEGSLPATSTRVRAVIEGGSLRIVSRTAGIAPGRVHLRLVSRSR